MDPDYGGTSVECPHKTTDLGRNRRFKPITKILLYMAIGCFIFRALCARHASVGINLDPDGRFREIGVHHVAREICTQSYKRLFSKCSFGAKTTEQEYNEEDVWNGKKVPPLVSRGKALPATCERCRGRRAKVGRIQA